MSKSALHATHLCTLLLVLAKGLSFTHVLIIDRFVMHCIICKFEALKHVQRWHVWHHVIMMTAGFGSSAAVKDMYISHMISMHCELMNASAHTHLLLQADHMPSLKPHQSGV